MFTSPGEHFKQDFFKSVQWLIPFSGGNYGGVGGGATAPPPIQQDSEIFAVEVGNFEGGIENAMKKRVAVEKEKQRVSILNEQTKCSRSICNIFFKFLCTNIPFIT